MNKAAVIDRAIDLILPFEGERLQAYHDSVGIPTIGVGITHYPDGHPVRMGDAISKEQSRALLALEVERVTDAVLSMVTVDLGVDQLASLVSFGFNVGTGALKHSTLLRLLNAGHTAEAAEEFLRWNKAGGHVLHGLDNRRHAERLVFLGQSEESVA